MKATQWLTVQEYQHNVVAVVERDRLVDAETIAAVADSLNDLLNRHPRISLVLDLRKVTAMSSMMLGKLVALHKQIEADRGRLAVGGVQKKLVPLFKVTRLDKVLKMFKTADEAIKKFERKPL